MNSIDAVVLAGGAASRLGGADKAMVDVAGSPLLSHVLAALATAGVDRPIVVGPRRTLGGPQPRWCREDPPGGGPVAGLAAALPLLTGEIVLVLGTDLPSIGPALRPLSDACAGRRVAVLVDGSGRFNYVAAAWPRTMLAAALSGAPAAGRSLRSVYAGLEVVPVADAGDWSTDCDTWADVEQARLRMKGSTT